MSDQDKNQAAPSQTPEVTEAPKEAVAESGIASSAGGSSSGFDYQPWDYFIAPKTQEELTNKYSILRRSIFSEDVREPVPESKSIREYISTSHRAVQDVRDIIQTSASLQMRYYAALPFILSPILLFRRRKLRKVFYSFMLTNYFLLPEVSRAIIDAK